MRARVFPAVSAVVFALTIGAVARAGAPKREPAEKASVAPSPRAPAPTFDLATVEPAASGPAADGLRAFRAGRWADAVDVLGRTPAKDLRSSFLLALALVRAGRHEEAAKKLLALETKYPVLADYHRYWAAHAFANGGAPEKAAAMLARVSADSPLRADAALLDAEARSMSGDLAAAATAYQAYLDGFPRGPRLGDAAWNLADVRSKLGDAEGARAAWRWVWARAATSPRAPEAEKKLVESGGLPALDAAERVARGQSFSEAEKHDLAVVELTAAIKLLEDAAAKRAKAAKAAKVAKAATGGPESVVAAAEAARGIECTARFLLGRTLHKQKKFAAAAAMLGRAADVCVEPVALEKALYHAANVSLVAGLAKKALEYATRLETEFPASSLADDAALFAARATVALGDRKRGEDLLSSIGARYPDGDVAEDALWKLAWDAYLAGDRAEAERWLDRAIETVPWVPTYYGAGRPLYWKGRLRALAGDTAAAGELWTRCLAEYPLSYYAAMSYARLDEIDAKSAGVAWRAAIEGSAATIPAGAPPGGADESWAFPSDALPVAPAFARGVELLRVGLTDEARKEFATLPAASDDVGRWLIAVLYDRAGAWSLSHNLPRRMLKGWERRWPVAAWKKHWLVAYPRGFSAEIEPAAAAAGVPPALLFALVREESAFDPVIESWANAIGLTQLLLSTAKGTAKKMDAFKSVTITADLLRDPAVNVPIGARFLGGLLTRWRHPILAIGGYNAGGGAVAKWVAERGDLELDEYVERIPYDQTRGYTKRVFGSYAVYTFLYEDTPLKFALGTAAAASLARK